MKLTPQSLGVRYFELSSKSRESVTGQSSFADQALSFADLALNVIFGRSLVLAIPPV